MEWNIDITKGPRTREKNIPTLVTFEPGSFDTIKTTNPLVANEFKFKLVRLLHDPLTKRRVDKIDPETDFCFLVSMADEKTKMAFDEPFHVAKVNEIAIETYLSQCAPKILHELSQQIFNEKIELTLQRTEFIDGTQIMSDVLEEFRRPQSHNEESDTSPIKHIISNSNEPALSQPQLSLENKISTPWLHPAEDRENSEIDKHSTLHLENQNIDAQKQIFDVCKTVISTDNNPTSHTPNTNKNSSHTGYTWLRIFTHPAAFFTHILAWLKPYSWIRFIRGY